MSVDDKRKQIIKIFIDEASTIVEDVSLAMMDLEADLENKDIVNQIFRGIHTLKGSANSFGFLRLGDFVHHFEDLLDIYRSREEHISPDEMDLLFSSFDVVKEVLELEINGDEGLPAEYDEYLAKIKAAVSGDEAPAENSSAPAENDQETELVSSNVYEDAGIDENEIASLPEEIKYEIIHGAENGEYVYRIILKLDDDIYFRGYNHTILLKLIGEEAKIAGSVWDVTGVPTFENFDPEINYIKSVSVYCCTTADVDTIDEIFDFTVEDHEILIHRFTPDEIKKHFNGKQEEEQKQPEQKEDAKSEEAPVEKKKEETAVKKTDAKPKVTHQNFIRIESEKVDDLFDVVGELVISQTFLHQNEKIRNINDQEIQRNLEALTKSTKMIQNKVMSLRMVPIRDTFNKMRMVARDVSKKTGKDVVLNIHGEETEIDKTMVDQLSDPLVHLIRNSIDHGIESSENRVAAGKAAKGQVFLDAYHRGGNIVIEIKDDGKGINKDAIYEKALAKGVCKEEETYTDFEIINFIFAPGFSTSQEISDVSGRGVGLDVVRSAIETLRGKIEVDTVQGEGSTFRLVLPLTLAIIDGLVVTVCGDTFIVPTLTVIESYQPKKENINTAINAVEFVNFRGEMLPIMKLQEVLHIEGEKKPAWEATLICLEHEKGKFIIQVDELVGRQQVVIKNLGGFIGNSKHFSGGAILGNGDISLILNVEYLRSILDKDLHAESKPQPERV